MKKKIAILCFMACFIWLCSHCAKSIPDLTADEALTLLQKISDSPIGLEISADSSRIQTALAEGAKKGNPRYVVTVNNPDISMSSAIYQQMEMEIPEFKLPIRAEELVFIYGPSDDYCEFSSAKNVDFFLDISELIGTQEKPIGDIPNVKLAYHFGSVIFKNYDISPLMTSKDKDIFEVMIEILSSAQNIETQIKDVRVELDFPDKGIQADLSLESAETRMEAMPELMAAFLKKEVMGKSFSEMLEEGKPLFNLSATVKNESLSIKGLKNDIQAGLDRISLEYYLKPSADKASFTFGYNLKLGSFHLTGLKKKEVEALTGINEMNLQFSLEQLSPEFLDTYFDMFRSARTAAISQDPAQQQEMGMKGMSFMNSFMMSKPILSLSLKPLDHKLGKVEAEGKFQFVQMGPPIGKAVVTISDVNAIVEKLKAGEGIPDKVIDEIMSKIKEVFVIGEDGKGTLTLEVKAEDPTKTYLNGKELF